MTDLPPWVLRLRPFLLQALLFIGVVGPLIILGLALELNDWPARRFLLLYLAPLIAAVAWWLRLRLKDLEVSSRSTRLFDLVVLATAATRLAGAVIPVSGHMLWLTYALLTTRSVRFRLVMLLLFVETTAFKLALWNDFRSWGFGALLGVLLAGGFWWSFRVSVSSHLTSA